MEPRGTRGHAGEVLTESCQVEAGKVVPQLDKIKIIAVSNAAGRSGSTLIARLFGEIDGCVNVGELQQLVFGLMRSNPIPCGCGKPPSACSFWKEIDEAVPTDVHDFARHWIRLRFFPLLRFNYFGGSLSKRLHKFLESIEKAYSEIARQANCRVIVECSQSPLYLSLVTRLPNVEVYVLHLVRDPQAVAMSWSKKKGYLSRQSVFRTLVLWSLYNRWFAFLGRRTPWYRRIRYEDFVERPQETLQSITDDIFERPMNLPFVDRHRAMISEQHHLAGNPDKLRGGEIVIRGGTSRPAALRTRMLTRLLTFPLLRRYGYL